MDKTTRLEAVKKTLTELKTKEPKKLEVATTKLNELATKFPDLAQPPKEDTSELAEAVRGLRLMIAYGFTQAGDKITPVVESAFKTYSGPYEFLQVKRSSQSSITYLFVALDNFLQKLERSHNVFILKKQGPRDVKVAKKDSDGNPIVENGEPVMETRQVLNITAWIDDMKTMVPLGIWGSKGPGEEVAQEHVPYQPVQSSRAYKMQLNYNGKTFFPAKDPMLKPLENFQPNWTEMVKYMTEKFPQMQEPFDAPGNMDSQKSYFMIGRVTKDASGGVIVSPMEPTTSIIQLQRTPDSRLLEDGDDVLILGNIGKSKGFKGRDGQDVKPTSDYTIFPSAVIRLSAPSSNNGNGHSTENGSGKTGGKTDSELKSDLGL